MSRVLEVNHLTKIYGDGDNTIKALDDVSFSIEQGEVVDRSWQERQNKPSDAEAVEGMGAISTHKNEHLMPTDKGIMLYRRRIRSLINSLTEGKIMPQPQQVKGESVRTYGQDTVLHMPKKKDNDNLFLKSVGSEVMKLQFDSENMSLEDRDNNIFKKLDYKIVSLDRVLLANFSKKDLGRGKWRFIEKIELSNFSSF